MFRRNKIDIVREKYQASIACFITGGDTARPILLLSVYYEPIPELFLLGMPSIVESSL